MFKPSFLRDHRLLGAFALALLAGALTVAHLQGGVHMSLGDVHLSVEPHREGGLLVSFAKAGG
jgi:hypothetical protein